jgi:uncharacterized membrane protein
MRLLHYARLHPRLLAMIGVSLAVFAALSVTLRLPTAVLIAWDAGALLYLALTGAMILRSDLHRMKRRANREDEGATVILALTMAAALASLAAIGAELHGIRTASAVEQTWRLVLAGITILCSWFFVNTIFAIHYAHEFYSARREQVTLAFPGEHPPDYGDFLYFSFTIGAAFQTSDVTILSRRMRRFVLAHTIIAFLFNTMILALTVNVGAGLL